MAAETPILYSWAAAGAAAMTPSAAIVAAVDKNRCFNIWLLLVFPVAMSRHLLGDAAQLVLGVHRFDQSAKALVHLLALHLAGRRDRLAFQLRIERARQDAERLDL